MYKFNNLDQLNKRFRVNLINSLGGFKSVVLIGTKNKIGQSNLSIINSLFHLGSNPALLGFVVRPDVVERHTLENIIETNYFTVNHIKEDFYKDAHQTSARYPREVSEFEACNLEELYLDEFYAPFVAQSSIKIGMEFKEKIDVTLNGTIIMIGEVKVIYAPENIVSEDGFIDLEKAGSLTCSGLDSYHNTSKIGRLSYAKVDKEVTMID